MASQEINDAQCDYKSRKIRLVWTVAKALLESKTKEYILSPPFKVNIDGSACNWNVRLDFLDRLIEDETQSKCFHVYLDVGEAKDWKEAVKIAYDISLKSSDGNTITVYSCANLLTSRWDEYEWNDEIEILPEFCGNEKVVIVFDVTLPLKNQFYLENEKDSQSIYEKTEGKDKLLENFIGMHKLSAFSDLIIFCGDQKFLCHKLLLASRSTVFREMLENEKEGKIDGELEITDTSPDVFKIILDYINTGEIEDDVELGTEVFKQAVKYKLLDLAKMCEVVLLKSLSEENCLSTFVVIDKYKKDSSIRQDIINFISVNAINLMTTDNWKSFSSDYPHLMTDIIRFLVTKCQQDNAVLPTLQCEGEEATS